MTLSQKQTKVHYFLLYSGKSIKYFQLEASITKPQTIHSEQAITFNYITDSELIKSSEKILVFLFSGEYSLFIRLPLFLAQILQAYSLFLSRFSRLHCSLWNLFILIYIFFFVYFWAPYRLRLNFIRAGFRPWNLWKNLCPTAYRLIEFLDISFLL